jgi:hypothetical protein
LDIQNIVAELKSELDRISRVIGLLDGNAPTKTHIGRPPTAAKVNASPPRKSGGLTSAGRRKLSEAMKKRWAAKRRGATRVSTASASVAAAATPKKRGGITAAGRKRLSDAMKKRWAVRKRRAS